MSTPDGKTLHEFERRLVPVRSTAGCDESWHKYEDDMLPSLKGAPPREFNSRAEMRQGFDAGYDAAMNRVRGLLATLQTESLRETEIERHPDLARRAALEKFTDLMGDPEQTPEKVAAIVAEYRAATEPERQEA
jgi:hypothetical protein